MKTGFKLFIVCAGLVTGPAHAQTLTPEKCYEMARQHYPLSRQLDLISKSNEYSVQNLSKGFLPQVNLTGQATYQSEVTRVPLSLPGISIPTPSKDQYKVSADISQLLYDGGMTKLQKEAMKLNAASEIQKTETELYKLKERINQLYFGTLLLNEQIRQITLLEKDLTSALEKTSAGIANGSALPGQLDNIRAELLRTSQRIIELGSGRTAYLEMLGMFIGQNLDSATVFQKPLPESSPLLPVTRQRPELMVFDYQHQNLDIQQKLADSRKLPRLSLFAQTGFGRPALNMLSNTFEPYFLGGLRLSWSLSAFYTARNDDALIRLNRSAISVQRETFLFNNDFQAKQYKNEIIKYKSLLGTDDEIVRLRTNIKSTAMIQLENGIITTHDFLREANAEEQARQQKTLHEVQLLMSEYQLKTITGSSY